MSFEIETRQAVAAMQAAVRECQDVIDLAASDPDETLEGRGYASVVDTMGDMVRILNNGLRRLGEAPVLPAKPEKPAEPEQDPETTARLEEAKRKLAAAEEALAQRPEPRASEAMLDELEAEPIPDEPPAGIADLFHPDRPYAEQAQALWEKYKELTNKLQMGLATPEEIKKQSRLQGDLDWIKHHAFEGV